MAGRGGFCTRWNACCPEPGALAGCSSFSARKQARLPNTLCQVSGGHSGQTFVPRSGVGCEWEGEVVASIRHVVQTRVAQLGAKTSPRRDRISRHRQKEWCTPTGASPTQTFPNKRPGNCCRQLSTNPVQNVIGAQRPQYRNFGPSYIHPASCTLAAPLRPHIYRCGCRLWARPLNSTSPADTK